ncbi:MAG: TonB-dependent receptor [Acidobacteria bacterium]|nr:TonB-dependent receptor [Acidobacteriota bacterium]
MLRKISRALVLMGLFGLHGFGQQTGQMVGSVTDSSGAVVPGATIKATEVGTGFVRTTIAGSDGEYVLTALRPAHYEVTVEHAGFRTFRRTGIELLDNQSLTIHVALDVGAVTETVNVAAAAVQVNTSTSALSEVVDNARILDLVLNGRDVAKLAAVIPGVAVISVSTETGKSIPGGLQLSSNGTRNGQVAYKLDGTTNTDPYFQENQTFPFPDAVQEFSITTSNYSAAQGNNSGAIVNVVTRSGNNSLHGGAFEFVRNRVFNARPYFSPAKDFLKRNQFGAYGGGPVRLPGYDGRNKTFFFMGWQRTEIRNIGNPLSTFAPTNDERNGNFSTCGAPCNRVLRDPLGGNFPNNQIPVSRFDPAAVKVNSYIPAVGGDGFMVVQRPINWQQDQGVAKVDHQVTLKDRLSARYFIDHFVNAGSFDPKNLLSYRNPVLASRVRSQSAVLTYTRTMSATLLNDFHLGFNRIHAARGPFFSGVPSMQDLGVRLPVYPSLPSISQIEPSGFFSIGDNLEAKFPRTGFEWANRTSWVRGRHSLQFGGEVNFQRADIANQFRRAGHFVFSGDVTGLSMADYFLGSIRTFDQGTGEYKANRNAYPALYFQDDWKVRPRLTLNLGIRYEPTPPWREERGRIQIFRIEDFAAKVKSSKFANAPFGETFRGDPGAPPDGTLGDYNNFGGRAGFAWDVFGDGKTSLRGGAGMFYDQHLQGDFNNNAVNAPPWSIRLSVTQPQGPFSDPYRGRTDFSLVRVESIGDPNAPFPQPVLISTYDPRQETPLTYNWNLTLEREVRPEWLARAAYVGSSSLYNRTTKQLNPAQYIPGSPLGTDARRLFAPVIGNVDYYTQDRRAHYHSLQLSLTKRFSHGFTVLAGHTYSKSMDTFGDFVKPWYFPNGDAMQQGPSDFDHKQRFVLSWVWDAPKARTGNGFLKHVLNGWQWSGNGQYQTGAPFNIKSGRDNSLTGLGNDRPKLTGVSTDPVAGADKRVWFNPAAFAINDAGTFGTLGRNALYGPRLHGWDLGFFKNNQFGERVRTQFRAEMFNIFNQVNFNNPNTTVTGGGFGTITSSNPAGGDSRIIQFGLKVTF